MKTIQSALRILTITAIVFGSIVIFSLVNNNKVYNYGRSLSSKLFSHHVAHISIERDSLTILVDSLRSLNYREVDIDRINRLNFLVQKTYVKEQQYLQQKSSFDKFTFDLTTGNSKLILDEDFICIDEEFARLDSVYNQFLN